jgi:alanine-glyoxylate transaminase/(R)-3-amino-2-methylpropionate-pyruvate transaminase
MNTPLLPRFDYTPKPYTGPSREEVLRLRRQYLTPSLLTYYKSPVMIVEGRMQYLYDETGRRYLDGLGGIVTVCAGHCHPEILKAVDEQIHTLQHATTIYLHPVIAQFAEKLASKMPGDLKVCYFVNSGSEANDLALLMARAYTGNYDVIALRQSYHVGVASTMGLTSQSTWKYNVPHGFGVQFALSPDPYRGPWGHDDPDGGRKYAADVKQLIDFGSSGRVAGFFAESIQGVGGAIVFPDGYLAEAYRHVRAAGGLCIADEVQTGFGRTGTHFWGFETQGVIPDIVVMAKSIGNGCPLAAVVTTPEIASKLAQRVHFNTFGGNPVSCAQGKATLEVIEREGLQNRSLVQGARIMDGLRQLQKKHDIIGNVRGKGLLIGVDLVKDRGTKEPATEECARVFETAKDLGLLLGKGGFRGNVLRISPPMCITDQDVDFMLAVLDQALQP